MESALGGLLRRRQEVSEAAVDRRRASDELQGRLNAVDGSLLESKSRLRSIEEVVAAGEGLGEGVKAILKDFKHRPGSNGYIIGLLADLFETEVCYERAVAAALDARIQDVVVEDQGHQGDRRGAG